MMIQKIINQIKSGGYSHVKNIFDVKTCNSIASYLENMDASIKIPFSSVPWGYGNLINNPNLADIYENQTIVDVCRNFLDESFVFNHLMVNNKAPWIGPGVEWHQEIFNVNTYAPGAMLNEDSWKNFLQSYIAIDKHIVENGCLQIIPMSHRLGVLPHEDIVNENFGHKRRVPSDVMDKIYEECGMKNILMEPGDVLFFNHRLVHGSSSNTSPLPRKAAVLQARTPFKKDNETFDEETAYRSNFVFSALQEKVDNLKQKNIYKDFRKTT